MLCFPYITEKGSSLPVEIPAKATWAEDGWFCKRSPHAPRPCLAPILAHFQVWLQFAPCKRISLASLCTGAPACSTISHCTQPPLFWESKSKRGLLPEYVHIAAALLVGARALLSSAVRCSCSLTAQKPAPLRGRCVVVGRVGCVSWTASKIVFCFNRPEWLMILTFALIAV